MAKSIQASAAHTEFFARIRPRNFLTLRDNNLSVATGPISGKPIVVNTSQKVVPVSSVITYMTQPVYT